MRHARMDDLDDIFALAQAVGTGMTTLPADKATLQKRLERTARTLAGQTERADSGYLFALEKNGRVVGLSAVEVALGMHQPFYNFCTNRHVKVSKILGVRQEYDTLTLSNDYTGNSELCTLFVHPDHRTGGAGKLASKARFLFIAANREKFAKTIIAEMRGVSDDKSGAPLWDALGKHFFGVDFATADRASATLDRAFIAELAPQSPIYLHLLPKSAQAVIGQVHEATAPALKLLGDEGLRHRGYVDIFDGGPNIEADIDDLRAIKESRMVKIGDGDNQANDSDGEMVWLVSNDCYQDFTVILAQDAWQDDALALNSAQRQALGLDIGASVRILALEPKNQNKS